MVHTIVEVVTKIVIIGTSDTVGRVVTEALNRKYEMVRVGCIHGDYQVDITLQESVEALFEKVGRTNAIVPATGNLFSGPLSTMIDQDFSQGLQDRLLDQICLVLTGQHFLNAGGSTTLISGIIAHEPITQGINTATINAGLEGSVRAVICELGHGQRISLIDPIMLNEFAEAYDSFFPGLEGVLATTVANAYRRNMEGIQTECTYKVGY